jgi:hypothetical protein
VGCIDWVDQKLSGPVLKETMEKDFGPKGVWAESIRAAKIFLSNFLRVLSLKIKGLTTFILNLNWNQTKINLNKLFEYFANLELLEIDLNIQI